ncbi:MAG: hypothetical protein QW067_00005, partial [Thermofilaceae archaeon]
RAWCTSPPSLFSSRGPLPGLPSPEPGLWMAEAGVMGSAATAFSGPRRRPTPPPFSAPSPERVPAAHPLVERAGPPGAPWAGCARLSSSSCLGRVEVESAEIRDGKLVVRSRGGEEVVLGEPTDLKWELPDAERWFPFPLGAVERILRVAGREWSIGDFIRFEVREGRMRVSGCGLSYSTLTGCEGEYKVTLRLRTLADALRAFKIAGLVPGSVGFAPMRLLTLVLLRGGWLRTYIAPFIE